MKLKKLTGIILAIALCFSIMPLNVLGGDTQEATERSGVIQPVITIEAAEVFTIGAPFTFTVTSDIGGILSVDANGFDEIPVESQWIGANEPFFVTVDAMPDVRDVRFVIIIRPESLDLEHPAITSMELLEVTADDIITPGSTPSIGTSPLGAPLPSQLPDDCMLEYVDASSLMLPMLEPLPFPENWTYGTIGQSGSSMPAVAGAGANAVYTFSDNGTSGNIDSNHDRGSYAYKEIPKDANFRISGWVTITGDYGNTGSGSAVGFMMWDGGANPTLVTTGQSKSQNMIVAGALASLGPAPLTSSSTPSILGYRVNNGSYSRQSGIYGPFNVGEPFYVELTRIGNQYYAYVNGQYSAYTMSATSGLLGTSDSGNIYVGMFQSRGWAAEFRGVTLEQLPAGYAVNSLTLDTPQVEAYQNVPIDLSNIQLKANDTSADGFTMLTAAQCQITGGSIDTNAATGTVGSFTVSYLNQTLAIPFTVLANPVTAVRVITPPLQLSYMLSETTFNGSGIQVELTWMYPAGGYTKTFDDTAIGSVLELDGIDALNGTTSGMYPITVRPNPAEPYITIDPNVAVDPKDTFQVQKIATDIMAIGVATAPMKLTYYSGTAMPNQTNLLRGVIVIAYFDDGSEEMLDSTEYTTNLGTADFNGGNTATWGTPGVQTLIFTYLNQTASIDFEIVNLAVNNLYAGVYPEKTTYSPGEGFDKAGLKVWAQNNDGTFVGGTTPAVLTENADYTVGTSAFNQNMSGEYTILLTGIGAYAGINGSFTVCVTDMDLNPTTGWQYQRLGESAYMRNNSIRFLNPDGSEKENPLNADGSQKASTMIGELAPDTVIELETFSDGGKVTNTGYDGINFYYYKLPIYANFKLTATIDLKSLGYSGNNYSFTQQMSFGLMMRDQIAGGDGMGSDQNYSSIYMVGPMGDGTGVSNGVAPRYRDIQNPVPIEAPTTSFLSNQNPYPVWGTSAGAFLSKRPWYNPTISDGDTAYTGTDQTGHSKDYNTMMIAFERNNNNFSGTITSNGETKTWSYDNAIDFGYMDPDYIYVGFFTARDAKIVISNASMTVTDGRAEAPNLNVPAVPPTDPDISFNSSAVVSSRNAASPYTLKFSSSANGIATVYFNSMPLSGFTNLHIDAYTQYTVAQTVINGGLNNFMVEILPDSAGNYTSFDKVRKSLSVTFDSNLAAGDLYASPNGSGDGATENSPTTLADAVSRIAPGYTIYMLPGTYGAISLTADNSGNAAEGLKHIVARPGAEVVASISVVNGDFWHIKGVDFTGRLTIGGSDNVIELCTIHNGQDTGLQIGRATNTTGGFAANDINSWPARNVILNCESYGHKDPGNTNADGYGAKLTVGQGNHFIGCVSHHNIDDGFDFFAKTFEIGANTVEYCIAYRNGQILSEPNNGGADGNGFKLGGGAVPVQHVLKNSIAFENKNTGITSNSNPLATVDNCVSFDNYGGNLRLYSGSDVNQRSYTVSNVYSYRKNVAGGADYIEFMENGIPNINHNLQKSREQAAVPNTVYLGDGTIPTIENNSYMNAAGRKVTDAFFESVVSPTWTSPDRLDNTTDYRYERDAAMANTAPSGHYSNDLIWTNFLKLTNIAAGHHTTKITVSFDTNGGSANPADVEVFYGNYIPKPAEPIRTGAVFKGWYVGLPNQAAEWNFGTDVVVATSAMTLTAKWETRGNNGNNGDNNDNDNGNKNNGSSSTTTLTTATTASLTVTNGNSSLSAAQTAQIVSDAVQNKLRTVVVSLTTNIGSAAFSIDSIKVIQENNMNLSLVKDGVTLTIPYKDIKNHVPKSAKNVVISITPVSAGTITDIQNKIVKDKFKAEDLKQVFNLSFTVDGQNVTSFDTPVSISISNAKLGLKTSDKATGFRLNNDLSPSFLGGKLNTKDNCFEFVTDRLSTYGVMLNNGLTSLSFMVGSTAYSVNSMAKTSDVAPFVDTGTNRTLVPLRVIAEGLGADVQWTEEIRTVTINLNGQEIVLTIGVLELGMDTPAIIVNNRTMVPLRYVSEKLGANVVWDGSAKTIAIYK